MFGRVSNSTLQRCGNACNAFVLHCGPILIYTVDWEKCARMYVAAVLFKVEACICLAMPALTCTFLPCTRNQDFFKVSPNVNKNHLILNRSIKSLTC